MEQPVHTLNKLFAQLGQACDDLAIARFIDINSPLPDDVRLHEATFWSLAQSTFLREAIDNDADWSDVADELNSRLHAHH